MTPVALFNRRFQVVSPAGFGKETTRRPSLVIQDKESGIDQYFSTDSDINALLSQIENNPGAEEKKPEEQVPNPDDQKAKEEKEAEDRKREKAQNAFNRVADFIRKVTDKDELQGLVEVVRHQLNEKNLNDMLVDVENSPRVPLLTVIRCKGGRFLSPGVAIVDMPGLDGSRSNWRENPIHEWVVERAEFFFFVQSSVATFNSETVNFLKKVVGQAKKPPVWAIQNIFDAQHWQPEEKRKKAEKAQRDDGAKRIRSLSNQEPRAVVPLNLGLAWDGKCEPSEVWLQKSEFLGFEKNLSEILNSERASMQEDVCLEKMEKALSGAARRLSQTEKAIDNLRSNHKHKRDTLKEAQALLNAVKYERDWEAEVKGGISSIAENAAKPWLDSLKNEIAKLSERHKIKRTGIEINAEIANAAIRLAAEGDSKHFSKPPLLSQYVELANKICNSAENEAIHKCNELLAKVEFSGLPAPISATAQDLPSLSLERFNEDKLKEHPLLNPLWKTKYDPSAILIHFELVGISWRQQIHARKDGWANELLNEHFKTYCEKRRKHLRSHIERLLTDFEAKVKGKEETATTAESLLRQMNEGLRNLELPLTNAVASSRKL